MNVRFFVKPGPHSEPVFHEVHMCAKDEIMQAIGYYEPEIIACDRDAMRSDINGSPIYENDLVAEVNYDISPEDWEVYHVKLGPNGWHPFSEPTGHRSNTRRGEIYMYQKVGTGHTGRFQ
jgi:hypothetical protein